MEYTREIYWNVGVMVLAPMYMLAALAITIAVYGFNERLESYKKGKEEDRSGHPLKRAFNGVALVLTQAKVIRGSIPGLVHAFFFWAFLVLMAGTTLIFIQTDFTAPYLGYRFLQGEFYLVFSLALDLAGLVAMVALGALLFRRYILKPEGLAQEKEYTAVYALLFSILATGFWVEGLRMAATEIGTRDDLAVWSPVGMAVGMLHTGWAEETIRSVHGVLWWVHMLLSFGFIAVIPYTMLRHLVNAPSSYVLKDMEGAGHLATLDLEDESAETFGVKLPADLSWKDLFDADTCIGCARCQDRCPAHNTGKALSPMEVMRKINKAAPNEKAVLVELISKEAVWDCVFCAACQDICPVGVEHIPKIAGMRRSLALMEGEFPGEEVVAAMNGIEVSGNPFGMAPSARADWLDGAETPVEADGSLAEVLYFPGCYASYDPRNRKIARSFMRILKSAGVKAAILGKQERCCGEPARKMGNEYLYQQTAAHNVKTINGSGAPLVVSTCPHCQYTLDRDYRKFGLEPEVLHYTVYLERLMAQGRLRLKQEPAVNATYHDSCTLGRISGVYKAPRRLLASAGISIREMERSGRNGACCGGGGGRILADETRGEKINQSRVKMAAGTGAGTLVSNCPFCLSMFEDGVKTAGLEEQINPIDMAEIIAGRLY